MSHWFVFKLVHPYLIKFTYFQVTSFVHFTPYSMCHVAFLYFTLPAKHKTYCIFINSIMGPGTNSLNFVVVMVLCKIPRFQLNETQKLLLPLTIFILIVILILNFQCIVFLPFKIFSVLRNFIQKIRSEKQVGDIEECNADVQSQLALHTQKSAEGTVEHTRCWFLSYPYADHHCDVKIINVCYGVNIFWSRMGKPDIPQKSTQSKTKINSFLLCSYSQSYIFKE